MKPNITHIDDNDYNRYSVIKPPSEFFGDNEKYTRIIVDSRVRNESLFPSPNDYEIPLDDDINDVIKAQLVYIDVPFSSFLINDFFNKLVINVGGTDYVVTLDKGDYDKASLLTELQLKLNGSLGTSVVTVSVNAKTDSFSFTSGSPFTIKFVNVYNHIGMLLGFRMNMDYSSIGSGPYIVDAPYRMNFNFNNYLIMDIDQFDLLKSVDKDLNKTFAVIPKNYEHLNLADNPQYIKRFSPPIPRLSKLRIKFYDRFGNNYDFQNMDHRFELLITSFNQKRKYGNIFAT